MSEKTHPRNDGWSHIDYHLLDDPERNAELSATLNEACHVFRHHAEGVWRSQDKDAYARLLAGEIARTPSLTRALLNTGDRVIKMLTYRAIELSDTKETGSDGPV